MSVFKYVYRFIRTNTELIEYADNNYDFISKVNKRYGTSLKQLTMKDVEIMEVSFILV